MATSMNRKSKTHKFGGLICTSHEFEVPLDYANPNRAQISLFVREVISAEHSENAENMPVLLFLQGGPGFGADRPESASGWMKRALKTHRVMLIDERGTGLSNAVTHETLATLANATMQAEYLKFFRADNIVRDCEMVRKALLGEKKWTVLGQSYGGFCATTYLSFAPEGLAGAIMTGGLPPLVNCPDDVYRATYKMTIEKNKIFYDQFPDDVKKVRKIVDCLYGEKVLLPTGEILSPSRFLQLGLNFGFNSAGRSMTTIHYMMENAFVQTSAQPKLSYQFLRNVESMNPFNTNPIYALLHESIYCQKQASDWSAERMVQDFQEFSHDHDPVCFTGETIYPFMFDEYECLKPLKEAAQILAEFKDWPALYDIEVLKSNSVPCSATIYYNDLYVDRVLAEETGKTICGAKYWITNEYEHDGIREDGEKILDRLLEMLG